MMSGIQALPVPQELEMMHINHNSLPYQWLSAFSNRTNLSICKAKLSGKPTKIDY
jgi:hypothetical protein